MSEPTKSDGRQTLSIEKQTDPPGIISFYSVPAEGVQNLPGADVELRWRTYRLNDRELTQAGQADPLPCDFSSDEGTKTIAAVAADMQFQLCGYDGSRSVKRSLTVKVLHSGWYERKNVIVRGDPGYPSPQDEAIEESEQPLKERFELEPALLLNANDQRLYALFRHEFQGNERALLFETENPFAGWRFVTSSVPYEEGFVPEGFGTSPGVYLDDKIWLIGGSQIDPDNRSNGVWCLDPQQGGAWENRGAAQWCKRMGHAVLVYENQIWVMGGRDEAGNPLDDVWTLDVKNDNRVWKPRPDIPLPSPRCLFAPAVFDGKIWLYGGTKEPFSDDLYEDLYTYADGNWEEKRITGAIKGGNDSRKPIASSLQVFNEELYLFGTFRTINQKDKSEIVEQLAFRLSSPTTGTWMKFDAGGLQNWGADTSFSYQLVSFRNKMLIARALAYDKPNRALKVYVPG